MSLSDHGDARPTPMPVFMDAVLSRAQVANVIGVSDDTLGRMEAAGQMPARVRLSPRRFGYRCSTIERWLSEREERA